MTVEKATKPAVLIICKKKCDCEARTPKAKGDKWKVKSTITILTSIYKPLDTLHHSRIFSMVILHPQVAFGTALATLVAATLHTPIRLLTWNLRYDSQPNSISVEDTIASLPNGMPVDSGMKYYGSPAEVPWSTRRIAVANDVIFNRVDILGTFFLTGILEYIRSDDHKQLYKKR